MEEYQSYKMIIAKGSDKLSERINEELEAGFIPYGSPTISTTYIGDDEVGNPKLFTLIGQAIVLPYPDDDSDDDYPAIKE